MLRRYPATIDGTGGTNYCWWLKSCTSWYAAYPIIYQVQYIPGGDRVVQDLFHQQYRCFKKNTPPMWLDLRYCHPLGNTVQFLLLLSQWKTQCPFRNISCPTVLRNLPAPRPPTHPNQAKCISRFSSNYSIPIPHQIFKHSIRSSRNQKRKYQELIHKFARNSAASQGSFQRHLVTPRMMEFNPGHKPPQVTIAAFTCGTPVNREICWCPTGILSSCKDQILGLNV